MSDPTDYPVFLTRKHIEAVTGASSFMAQDWITREAIKSFKTPSGLRRFTYEAVLGFLEKHGYPVPNWVREGRTLEIARLAAPPPPRRRRSQKAAGAEG